MAITASFVNVCDFPGCNVREEITRSFSPGDRVPSFTLLPGWTESIDGKHYCPEHSPPVPTPPERRAN